MLCMAAIMLIGRIRVHMVEQLGIQYESYQIIYPIQPVLMYEG